MPRIFISDSTAGGTHGATVKAAILANNPNLVDADITLQLNATYDLSAVLADMETAFDAGYEAFVHCTTLAPQLAAQSDIYWQSAQTMRVFTPLGSNTHEVVTYTPDERGPQITCGASDGANNETGYGNALWFFDDDNGNPGDTSSQSTGVIAGKLLYIKDQRDCEWWEAIYAAMQTASENGTPTLNNGYGKIDVTAAIAWSGTVPYDQNLQVGDIGTLSSSRTLSSIVLTGAAVTNATEYTLEKNTGAGWEEVETQASNEFTVTLEHNIVTYFRYKGSNPNGDTEYSNTITALWAESIQLTFNESIESTGMSGISIGSGPVGSMINSYYTTTVVTAAAEIVMNADIVRRSLRVHYAKISNIELRDFIRIINDNVETDLSEWGMNSFTDLTDGQKAKLRLYYSYAIGEMIFLQDSDNPKLYERMKMLKKQIYSQMVPLSSGSYEYELERISNSQS
jgi:hypothetical protein